MALWLGAIRMLALSSVQCVEGNKGTVIVLGQHCSLYSIMERQQAEWEGE